MSLLKNLDPIATIVVGGVVLVTTLIIMASLNDAEKTDVIDKVLTKECDDLNGTLLVSRHREATLVFCTGENGSPVHFVKKL